MMHSSSRCNVRKAPGSRSLSPGFIEAIEQVYGEGCGTQVKDALRAGNVGRCWCPGGEANVPDRIHLQSVFLQERFIPPQVRKILEPLRRNFIKDAPCQIDFP